jgi:sec-independent protein translocase protein TatA
MFRNPTTDLIIVLVIVLLIFGPKRLPTLGKQLGSGLREFKDSITGDKDGEPEERPQIQQANQGGATEPAPANLSSERSAAEVASPERRS